MIHAVSYNVARGKKIDKIYTWITSLSPRPDVMCFQEFPQEELRNNFFNNLGYSCEFVENIAMFSKKYGQLTAFNKKKVKLINKKIVHLGKNNLEVKIFGYERRALITNLMINKKLISIANVHLVLLAGNKTRQEQLSKVIEKMNIKNSLLVIGDFNYPSIFKNQLDSFFINNGFFSEGIDLKTFSLLGLKYQLDYIYLKRCYAVKAYTKQLAYSDHFPLLVNFSLK